MCMLLLIPNTLFLSVVLFVVFPILASGVTKYFLRRKGIPVNILIKKFNNVPEIGLLLTLVLIFMFQGEVITNNPFNILLISVPLVIQTVLIFFIAYFWSKKWKISHDIGAPSALIGASNHFEVAIATSAMLFGLSSGASLATVVGVLIEVPLMLLLVKVCLRTKDTFK